LLNLAPEGIQAERLSTEIVGLDGTIIFAAIGTVEGKELGSATKPSASLLVETDEVLRANYGPLVAVVIRAFKQGETSLGKMSRIVTTFQNLKCIVIPNYSRGIFAIVLATRDSEENRIAFQVSQYIERFIRE
jgi:hypothetical protein